MDLKRWINKRRKVLASLPDGTWYQGGNRVNGDKNMKDLVINTRYELVDPGGEVSGRIVLRRCIAIGATEEIVSWIRESKEEMTKALDIIEALQDEQK